MGPGGERTWRMSAKGGKRTRGLNVRFVVVRLKGCFLPSFAGASLW